MQTLQSRDNTDTFFQLSVLFIESFSYAAAISNIISINQAVINNFHFKRKKDHFRVSVKPIDALTNTDPCQTATETHYR